MQWCGSIIASFVLGHHGNILFVPYAAVGFSYDAYTQKVNEALEDYNLTVTNLDNLADKAAAISEASAIFVGGGNTFHLLKILQDLDLVDILQQKVEEGTPYVGWSAGSNITSPTICTTNDMPIVQPKSFDALKLVNFQINPHYTERVIENHGGESRKTRLTEYLAANEKDQVVCLPEATYLSVSDGKITYRGNSNAVLLTNNNEKEISEGDTF